jgi:hypothetical protein
MTARRIITAAVTLTSLGLAPVARPATAQVRLNEMTIRPVGVSESVELYNGGDTVTLDGWIIHGSKGTYTIPPGTTLPPDSYSTFDVGDIMYERGGVTSLIDLVRGGGRNAVGIDSVYFGTEGSAPLPPAGTSLARAPDAADGPTPPPDPDLDGLVWTIDFTPTWGTRNDAPPAQPGISVVINEFDPTPPGGQDLLELYNPTPVPTALNGWHLVNGDAVLSLNGYALPFLFVLLTTPTDFDLEATELLYLFRFDGVRVDQIGFHNARPYPPPPTDCFARCPDGAEPFLGYDFASSGGGSTFVERPCTPGVSNCTPGSVPAEPPAPPGISDSPDPPPPPGETQRGSWGGLKMQYQPAKTRDRQ